MTFDFHTHSFFSDGVLSPIELIRRAHVAGYRAIAVTDHIGLANMESTIREGGSGSASTANDGSPAVNWKLLQRWQENTTLALN